MAEEIDTFLAEIALAQLAIQLMFSEEEENLPQMILVVGGVLAVHQDVVKIDDDELVKQIVEDIVHQRHKSRRSVSQAKRENSKLKMSKTRAKSCLVNISRSDADLVVSGTEINFGKDLGTLELVHEVIDTREGIPVLDGVLVECTVIDAEMESSFLLVDEKNWSTER